MLIMRTLIWFIYFWLYLIFTIPYLFVVRMYDKRDEMYQKEVLVDKITKNWAKSLVNLTGSKVNIIGRENLDYEGPVVFVSNHQGNFDIPLLIAGISKPKGFIAKYELKKMPIINKWMEVMHCVFIKRNHPREALKAINEGIRIVKKGHSLVIFPEGTRSKGMKMGEFKPGSLRLATKAQVPIVPVTIKGSFKIMEANGWLMSPAEVDIHIEKPMLPSEYNEYDAKNLTNIVKEKIANNLS